MSAPDVNVPEDAADAGRAPSHRRSGPLAAVGSAVREVVVVIAMALLLSFVVKTWLLQAFFIPSGSMEDTLLVGDRVIVSKLTPTPFAISRGDVALVIARALFDPAASRKTFEAFNAVTHDAEGWKSAFAKLAAD